MAYALTCKKPGCEHSPRKCGSAASPDLPSPNFHFNLAPWSRRKPPIRIVLGTASFGASKAPLATVTTVDEAQTLLELFRNRGYVDLDTARIYPVGARGKCEELLGSEKLRLHKWANISTKIPGFQRGDHHFSKIAQYIDQSLAALKTDAVDVMYLHGPDLTTPLVEVCRSMHQAFTQGKFERFGLSNYPVDIVDSILRICEHHRWVMPSVYQGQYNCLCRDAEDNLLRLLREHDITFLAYSPAAGGFLADPQARMQEPTSHPRWQPNSPLGARYRIDYGHEVLTAAANTIQYAALPYGITAHAASLRWMVWHSALVAEMGDGIVLGVSSVSQLEQNLDILEQGPLPECVVKVMQDAWETIQASGRGPTYHLSSNGSRYSEDKGVALIPSKATLLCELTN